MAHAPDSTITCPDCGVPITLTGGVTGTTASETTAIIYSAEPVLQHIREAHPAEETTDADPR